MLFDGETFFQYIEGPQDGLDAVMGRISNASTHQQIEVLADQRIGTRLVPYWSMQVFEEHEMDLSLLSYADWSTLLIPQIGSVDAAPAGLVDDKRVLSGVERLLDIVRRRLNAA